MEKPVNRLQLQHNLIEHEGHTLFRSLLKLRGSLVIYSANYFELKSELNSFKNLGKLQYHNAYRWRRQRKIIRAIHNLIFSGQSYFEHIQVSNYQHVSPAFHKLKSGEIADLKKDPLFHFFRSLRNFITHRQPCPLISRSDGIMNKNGQRSSYIYQSLKTNEFEGYLNERIGTKRPKDHDKMAYNYLKTLPEKIDFDDLILEYHKMVSDFHHLIMTTLIKENLAKLKDFENQIAAMHKEFNTASPIDKLQARYLRFLIMKAEQEL